MKTHPGISAVIPVYNGEAYLGEAIASALAQTRAPAECIVVDDGSTDATAEVARAFGTDVTYLRQENAGVSVARNLGAARAQAELIAFLDHDDVWMPEKLALQVDALMQSQATMALCGVAVVDAAGHELAHRRMQLGDDLIVGMLMFDGTEIISCSSTGLIARSVFIEMGGFDPQLSMSADWDLVRRILFHGRLAYVDEPLVRYRVHGTNMSRDIASLEHDMTYAFAKAFGDPGLPDTLRRRKRRAYARMYRMLAGSYWGIDATADTARMMLAAVRQDPGVVLKPASSRRR